MLTNEHTIYLATNNRHKLEEFKKLTEGTPINLKGIADLNHAVVWDENGKTFAENALIKALAVRGQDQIAVLADDSGLVVPALEGAPGVFSSRYAGKDGDDAANNQKLINELTARGISKTPAQFVCCLAYIDESGSEEIFTGQCDGEITIDSKGDAGFGYDPLFFIPSLGKTFAELSAEEKNRLSHRAVAYSLWRNWYLRGT